MRVFRPVVLMWLLLLLSGLVSAQTAVTSADIARLEATAADLAKPLDTLSRTDPMLAASASKTLADLRDDITYLRVKLRRDGSVTGAEYSDVRDRLETLRVKVEGAQRVTALPVLPPGGDLVTLPVGTELDVRLQTPLNSGVVHVEQRFEATTVLDFTEGRSVAVPAGSVVRGFVSSVRPAGRLDRAGSLTLSFDEMVIDQHISKLRASVVKALDPKMTDDLTRISAGAVVGAVIGGVIGGGKGALVGVLVGGGGTMASTEGTNVDLPVGTILRIRMDEPLQIPAGK
jgi:hypothetical protein